MKVSLYEYLDTIIVRGCTIITRVWVTVFLAASNCKILVLNDSWYLLTFAVKISNIFVIFFSLLLVNLKVVSAIFLLVCFSVFYFTSKALLFSRKSNFNILDIQISWRHQMSKYKRRKHILLNNLRSKHSLLMKFGQFISYCKRKHFVKKTLQKLQPEN